MTVVGYGGGCRRRDGIVDNAIEFDEMQEPLVKLERPMHEEAAKCSWIDPWLIERVTASSLEALD